MPVTRISGQCRAPAAIALRRMAWFASSGFSLPSVRQCSAPTIDGPR
jgi:hypothetical protein